MVTGFIKTSEIKHLKNEMYFTYLTQLLSPSLKKQPCAEPFRLSLVAPPPVAAIKNTSIFGNHEPASPLLTGIVAHSSSHQSASWGRLGLGGGSGMYQRLHVSPQTDEGPEPESSSTGTLLLLKLLHHLFLSQL